jgi:tetratricopeptide (TPR) repeat protein
MQKYLRYYIDIGRAYANRGKYSDAIWFYQRALIISPHSDTAYCNMGLAYYHIDEVSKALNMCKKAIYSNPKNIELYKHLGMLYNDMQDYYRAYKAYSMALKLNPRDLDSLIYLGDFYGVIKRDYNSSKKFYDRAIREAPKDYRAYYHLAYLYIDRADYKKAIKSLKKSISLHPFDADIYHNLFELQLIKNMDFDSSLEQSYIKQFKNSKRDFAIYEMLKLMRDISKGKKVSLKSWSRKYKNIYLPNSWQFDLLEEWIEKMPKGIKKVKLTRALYLFKEHKKDTF